MMRDLRNDQRSQPSQETSHPSPGSFPDGSGRFTRGPLQARPDPRENGEWEVVKPDGDGVWYVAALFPCADGGTAEGNAHLYAAAPQMFEALLKAREWLRGWASAEPQLAVIEAALSAAHPLPSTQGRG